MPTKTKESGSKEKTLSVLLAFIVGFVGVSLLGAAILIILLTLGWLPAI